MARPLKCSANINAPRHHNQRGAQAHRKAKLNRKRMDFLSNPHVKSNTQEASSWVNPTLQPPWRASESSVSLLFSAEETQADPSEDPPCTRSHQRPGRACGFLQVSDPYSVFALFLPSVFPSVTCTSPWSLCPGFQLPG